MVYCGKPSRGCEACRERKTRCDKAEPSCSQCVRARRTCPGYRNQLDLMFRIQNDDVIEKSKAKARERVAKGKAKARTPVQLMEPLAEEVAGMDLEDAIIRFSRQHLEFPGAWALTIPQYVMTPTIEQRARGWFQTHSDRWLRNTDILDSMVSQTHGDDHLLASMYAVGLGSFSNHIHSPTLMAQSRKGYVSALRLTNAALRSPVDAKKDSTLFAIMILGIYETVAGTTAQSVLAWTSHINGAAALVEFRGVEQFNSDAGQRMFYQVISSMMISCLQRTVRMPARIIELRDAAARLTNTPLPMWILSGTIIDFTNFRADVRECHLVGPREIIATALEIDQRFIDLFAAPPADWRFQLEHTDEDPHLAWNKTFHKYENTWAPPIWNGMRTCRIMLHETIRDQLLCSASAITPVFSPAEADRQESESVAICLEMQRDIMRSVPRHRVIPGGENTPRAVQAGTHHAYIIWPLYLVGAMDLSTDKVREWVARRLRLMAEVEGINQAAVLAGYLDMKADFWDRKPDLKPWKKIGVGEDGEANRVSDMTSEMGED